MPSETEEIQKTDAGLQEKASDKSEAEGAALDLSKGFSKKSGRRLFSKGRQGTLYILFLIILGLVFQILYLYQRHISADMVFNGSILFILFLTMFLSYRAIKEIKYGQRLAALLDTNISFNPDLDYNGVLRTIIELGESFINGYSAGLFLIDQKRGNFNERVMLIDGALKRSDLSVIESALLGELNKSVVDIAGFKGKDLKKIAGIFGGRKVRSAYFLPLVNENKRFGLMVFFSGGRISPRTSDAGLIPYIPRISAISIINNEIYRENKEIEAKEMRKESEWRRKRLELEEDSKKNRAQLGIAEKELKNNKAEKERIEKELLDAKQEMESQIKKATDELAKVYLQLDNKEKEFGKKVLEQLAVKELNQAIGFLFDEEFIFDLVLNISVGELKAAAGAIMLLNPASGRLETKQQRGFKEDENDRQRLLGETIGGYVYQRKEPLLAVNLEKEPKFIPIPPAPSSQSEGAGRGGVRETSLLAVPVIIENNVVGVISLYNKVNGEVFNKDDLNILSALARQTATAVENSRLYEGIAQGKRLKSLYAKYLSESLMTKLKPSSKELDLVGTRQRAVVISLQISGLGQSSGVLPTNEAISLLNKYLSFLTDILYKYDAFIDRYTGNGFVAVFGIPFSKSDDARRAVTAGVDMVIKFIKQVRAEGDNKMNVGISVGISSGEVIIGEIGEEGSRRSTVIGDVVDLSSRLQWMALPGQVLVDEPTFRAVSDIFHAQKTGSIPVHGGKTMDIYGIVKLKR